MAIIKTEVDIDKEKKVAGKGVDYVAKELEQINSRFTKKINLIMAHLGISIDSIGNVESDGNLNDMSEKIDEVSETVASKVLIAKKYETSFTNTYNWDVGLVWSKNHGLGEIPDMCQVWARFSGDYYMLLGSQISDVSGSGNDIEHTSIVVSSTSIRFESASNPDDPYFYINGVQKTYSDITDYKIIAIKF